MLAESRHRNHQLLQRTYCPKIAKLRKAQQQLRHSTAVELDLSAKIEITEVVDLYEYKRGGEEALRNQVNAMVLSKMNLGE